MIGAFARASRVLGRVDYIQRARAAARFLHDRMWNAATGTLHRRYRDGEVAIEGYAEDYACAVSGALELFQADGDTGWLHWALTLQRRQDQLFWDEGAGGWFNTTGQDASVLLRLKEDYDGAEPSASSISVANLLVLAHLTGDTTWRDRVERTMGLFAPRLGGMSRSVPLMMANLSTWHAGVQQVVIVGRRDDEGFWELVHTVGKVYVPFAIVIPVEPGEHQARLAQLSPALAAMSMVDDRPTAYVCRNFACQQPTSDAAELRRQLGT